MRADATIRVTVLVRCHTDRGSGQRSAQTLHPRKGSVSLRASATFADGGAVDYTRWSA
jgi:hypothetical protein